MPANSVHPIALKPVELVVDCLPASDRTLATQASVANAIIYMSSDCNRHHPSLQELRATLTAISQSFQRTGNKRFSRRDIVQIARKCAGIGSATGLAVFAGTGFVTVDGLELRVLVVHCAPPEMDGIKVVIPNSYLLPKLSADFQSPAPAKPRSFA